MTLDTTQTITSDAVRVPRLWPAWMISAGLAVALVLTVTPSIANRPRFFMMMGGPVLGGLLFSIWLLLLSRLRIRDRFLLFAGWLAAAVFGVAFERVGSGIADGYADLRIATCCLCDHGAHGVAWQ
ncbi:MAG UNVERIFIED_CONTAM: hypothetical protein LVR18_37290 [Planctomycetaceae bacterium]|jgi:hypothetical protein